MRAAHDGVGEVGLGVLGPADDDHCRVLRSRCISVAYHTPDWARGQFNLGATALVSVPSLTVPTTPARHDAPQHSVRQSGAGRAGQRAHHRTSHIGGADQGPHLELSSASEVTETPSAVIIQRARSMGGLDLVFFRERLAGTGHGDILPAGPFFPLSRCPSLGGNLRAPRRLRCQRRNLPAGKLSVSVDRDQVGYRNRDDCADNACQESHGYNGENGQPRE